MDPSACNYDDTATIDDASCESLSCAGCTDPAYTEYDASATLDDGSCQTRGRCCITAIIPSFALDFGQPDNDLSTGDDEYSTVALPSHLISQAPHTLRSQSAPTAFSILVQVE